MSANRYISVAVSGIHTLYTAIAASLGVGDAGKIICTNASGVVDPTLLPPGVLVASLPVQASEALVAGNFVNFHNVTGALRVRKASGTGGLQADGFVLSAVASGATATVWLEGLNNAMTGLTIGSTHYLVASGGISVTPPAIAAGVVIQEVGVALSATSVWFTRQQGVAVV